MAEGDRLLEREHELGAIDEAIVRARTGAGRVLAFESQPGLGKTRLLGEVAERAQAAGMLVLRATGGALEQDLGWGVVRTVLGGELATSQRRERLLAGAAVAAAPLFTAASPAPTADAIGPILHGLYWLVSDLANAQPVALIVDDMHWADAPSARWIAHLAPRAPELPLLLAVAARPTAAASEWWQSVTTLADARLLTPGPLGVGATRMLVAYALGDPEEALADACHEVSGGNPFLLSELVRHVAANRDQITGPEQLRGLRPDSIRRAVLLRLAQLGEPATELCFAIAVLGREATLTLAAELASLDRDAAGVAADALVAADVIGLNGGPSFVHPLVLEIVRDEIPRARLEALHRAAAELLERRGAGPGQQALHLLATAGDDRPEVARTLQAAAAEQLALGAPGVAARYLRRAVAEPPAEASVWEVLFDLGRAEVLTGEETALDRLRQALAMAPGPLEKATVSRALATAAVPLGRFEEAVQILTAAIEQLPSAQRELALEMEAELATGGRLSPATHDAATERLQRVVARVRPTGATPAQRLILANLAMARLFDAGTAAEVADPASRALAGGLLEERGPSSIAFCDAVYALIVSDRLEQAESVCDAALARAARDGSFVGIGVSRCFRACLELRLGNLLEAQADALASVEVAREGGFAFAPMSLAILVDVLVDRGPAEEAERTLEVGGFAGELPDFFMANFLLVSRARLALARGNAAAALEDLSELGRREQTWHGADPNLHPYRALMTEALIRLDRVREAREVAIEELDRARRWGTPRRLGLAIRAQALAAEPDQAITLLGQSAQVLVGPFVALERARVLVELGAALRSRARVREAQPVLKEALELADRCAATPLAGRAREELLAVGARPRRARSTGPDALTPTELRVCRMAAEGSTNREIAQALFVSLRTIETHLTHAYQKLGVASRGEMARALDPGGGADGGAVEAQPLA